MTFIHRFKVLIGVAVAAGLIGVGFFGATTFVGEGDGDATAAQSTPDGIEKTAAGQQGGGQAIDPSIGNGDAPEAGSEQPGDGNGADVPEFEIDWDVVCKLFDKCDEDVTEAEIDWDALCKLLENCDDGVTEADIDWDALCKALGTCEPKTPLNPDLDLGGADDNEPDPPFPGNPLDLELGDDQADPDPKPLPGFDLKGKTQASHVKIGKLLGLN